MPMCYLKTPLSKGLMFSLKRLWNECKDLIMGFIVAILIVVVGVVAGVFDCNRISISQLSILLFVSIYVYKGLNGKMCKVLSVY